MGMDTLSYLVLDNFKSWSSVTPYFDKLLRAKRTSILIKDRKTYKKGVKIGIGARRSLSPLPLGKGGRWFQNDLTTQYKGDGLFVCQDSQDLMHPVPYIMLWAWALMEQRH